MLTKYAWKAFLAIFLSQYYDENKLTKRQNANKYMHFELKSGKSTWISNEYDGQYGEKERVITNFFSIQKCRCPQRYYKMKVHFDKTTNYDPSYL